MLRKLHTRVLISQVLPILILTFSVTFILLYFLQTHRSLGDLADQLVGQGSLITQIAQNDPTVWTDTTEASQLVKQVKSSISSRVMILDKQGNLLASSLDSDAGRVGTFVDFPVVAQALDGQTNWLVDYSPFMRTRILDMAIPVLKDDNSLIGIIRLSYDITAIEQRTLPLNSAIAIAFIVGTITALLIGLGLARSLDAPLLRMAEVVSKLRPGFYAQELPEVGPDEIRLVAQNYNDMICRLHQLELARQQLIANVVHELGTSLGAVKAAVEALRDGAASDEMLVAELALGMNSQINQMRLLIDDLALLGESEIKEITLHREWCDLEKLIQAQCHAYAYLADQKHIELSYNIKSPLPPVFVDSRRLGQILANLLHNAYKYCPSRSKIILCADTDTADNPEQIILEVVDNGPGISLEDQPKIFDLLYRSPQQRNMHKGMGIGLALSKRLAEAHGGTITVESTPGNGAKFKLILPLNSLGSIS